MLYLLGDGKSNFFSRLVKISRYVVFSDLLHYILPFFTHSSCMFALSTLSLCYWLAQEKYLV